jgi:Flp pilus assembly protein protease CpaA
VLVATLVTGAITDLRRRRIYNWTTYTAFLWAIAINLVATWYSTDSTPVFGFQPAAVAGVAWLGGVGIWQCVAGAAVCFAITLVGYDLSGGGAGDVKIAAAIGALLGVHQGVYAVIYSYIIAAVAIVFWAVWTHGPFGLAKAISRTLGNKLGPLWPFTPSDADAKLLLTPVPLGPYFAIGTLLVALELIPT